MRVELTIKAKNIEWSCQQGIRTRTKERETQTLYYDNVKEINNVRGGLGYWGHLTIIDDRNETVLNREFINFIELNVYDSFNKKIRSCDEEGFRREWNMNLDKIELSQNNLTEIDWEKVPIDTPVYVYVIDEKENKYPRHFAEYEKDSEREYFTVFPDGWTSFTKKDDFMSTWNYCELAREEDIEKYKKDKKTEINAGSEWKKYPDEKPEDSQDVLIVFQNKVFFCKYRDDGDKKINSHFVDNCEEWGGCFGVHGETVYWQQLQKPPEEESTHET